MIVENCGTSLCVTLDQLGSENVPSAYLSLGYRFRTLVFTAPSASKAKQWFLLLEDSNRGSGKHESPKESRRDSLSQSSLKMVLL
jgi:hypothetical protein